MIEDLTPHPNATFGNRRAKAKHVRHEAAQIRAGIPTPAHEMNGEYEKYAPQSPATFTKGLPHDKFGIVKDGALDPFVKFISQTGQTEFRYNDTAGEGVEIGADPALQAYNDPDLKPGMETRTWESPLAGHVYDLEGPDADTVTMPKAPKLGSGELAAEMAEIYALALLRDFPFSRIEQGSQPTETLSGAPQDAGQVIDAMKKVKWFTDGDAHTDDYAEKRRRARLDENHELTARAAFRGSTAGAMKGPYLSQFMLIGNADRGGTSTDPLETMEQNYCAALNEHGEPRKTSDGFIVYGAQEIDQRIISHKFDLDYMSDWSSWIDVQNGANFKNRDGYETRGRRFITTPRDLATYVHFDQLYQAYLNACILMLGYGVPFDSGLPEGASSGNTENKKIRDGFATFGGPHILSLVTEVATRALKFARRQKFNIHLRARPEVVAGMMTLAESNDCDQLGAAKDETKAMAAMLGASNGKVQDGTLLKMIVERNKAVNAAAVDPEMSWINPHKNFLLPMAFPEGSPMHPSYAAGHATVAGACVTMLKAFFEMFEPGGWEEKSFKSLYDKTGSEMIHADGLTSGIFEPDDYPHRDKDAPHELKQLPESDHRTKGITMLGELDKLAANISIGRDMAGVHFYTDYFESLRMGERVAVGILQEQMLTYPEKVSMRLKTFDGEKMEIAGHGDGETVSISIDGDADPAKFAAWFDSHLDPNAAIAAAGDGTGRKIA